MSNDNAAFTDSQALYLEGLARGLSIMKDLPGGSDAPAGPDAPMLEGQHNNEQLGRELVPEEKMKRERHPLDRWNELVARAENGEFPKGTDVLVTKFFGMFYVAPAQDSFMCRLRLPNGTISSYQLRGVSGLARRFAGPYAHVTTRASLQLREIGVGDPIKVLNGLYALGIVNKGAGADNVRNITGSPLSGIDADELYDTRTLTLELNNHILNTRELFGLPRKFNISIDGGGRAAVLAETNDIAFRAVRAAGDGEPEVLFRLGLGGITGHGDFASDTGLLLRPAQVVRVSDAILRVFIAHGDRSDRKKARLKYLLDAWGQARFLDEVKALLPEQVLLPASDFELVATPDIDRYAHIGVHAQKQPGLSYIGVATPVGRLSCDDMDAIADIADRYGSGTIRLTVWQNLVLSDIADGEIDEALRALAAAGFDTTPNAIRSNLVACTGNAGCKFAASDTKRHAMEIAAHLDEKVALDVPVNIHLTGCHHSCAQHYIGDIGLIACKVMTEDADLEGYDIVLGGDYGARAALAEPFWAGITAEATPVIIEQLLLCYLDKRTGVEESFRDFVARITLETLKSLVLERADIAA